MAIAKKCDRCGKCFDPFHMEGMMCRFRNPIFQNSNDIREGVIGKSMLNEPDAFIDLCPECAEMFDNFMRNDEPDKSIDDDGDNKKVEDEPDEIVQMAIEKLIHRWREDLEP